jgi:hypothetical protein
MDSSENRAKQIYGYHKLRINPPSGIGHSNGHHGGNMKGCRNGHTVYERKKRKVMKDTNFVDNRQA